MKHHEYWNIMEHNLSSSFLVKKIFWTLKTGSRMSKSSSNVVNNYIARRKTCFIQHGKNKLEFGKNLLLFLKKTSP